VPFSKPALQRAAQTMRNKVDSVCPVRLPKGVHDILNKLLENIGFKHRAMENWPGQ
jgi:hypothetical protein